MNALQFSKRSRPQKILLIAGIVLIAINLRPAISAIGPLINDIRAATGLTNAMLGFLTTLPLLAFGFISVLTPVFTKKLGIEGTLACALLLLIAGSLLRIIPVNLALFVGTLILGVGIAFGNVLLPSLIKRDFPGQSGIMTSVYSGMVGVGATIAAGLSIPLAYQIGWHWSIAAWSIPAIAALLVWAPQLKHKTRPKHKRSLKRSLRHLGGNATAWQVALYMGIQSFSYYVILAWLPEILQSRGLSPAASGWMLSLSQGFGFIGSISWPFLADKLKSQRLPVILLMFLEAGGILGLLSSYNQLTFLWVSLLGFGLGANFALALLFIVLRSANSEIATELSGMAQSIGYTLAAIGPALFGLMHDLTKSWTIPLITLLVVLALKIVTGLGASRQVQIE